MTNLTSEQYRDVLKHIPDVTEEIPNIQILLRRAVQTFYKRFGGYPEIAGVAPGKIGLFGDQTQFSDGVALPTATPMATIVVGRRFPGARYCVATSADVGKPHKVSFSFSRHRPLGPGCPDWLNYVKGVIDSYPEPVPPFEAAIESSVPMGVGFGSSAAVEVATYSFLEVLVGKKVDPILKAKSLQKAEKEFAGKQVGLVDRITSIMAKDRHAMMIDCKTNQVKWIPFRNKNVTMVAVNTHLKDELFGDEYPERTKHLAKACELLGIESLRMCTEEHLSELENKVNEILAEKEEKQTQREEEREEEEGEIEACVEEPEWTKEDYDKMIKRARFFVTEMNRINEAIEAWREGDVEKFGEMMKESHRSLKEDFDFSNPVLDFLVEASLEVEGVLGSRMTGMGLGFGGGIVTLVNKENVEAYCNYITDKFAEYESQLAEQMKETRQQEKTRRHEIRKKFHTEHFNPSIASSEKIGMIQDYLESGGALLQTLSRRTGQSFESMRKSSAAEGKDPCVDRKNVPCIVKVEKPKRGCGTWAHFQKQRDKEEYLRKLSILEEEEEEAAEIKQKQYEKRESIVSEVSEVKLQGPSFYIISPFAGARMMFVTKNDILRSRYAVTIPHPKTLVRTAMAEYEKTFGGKVEAVALAPGTARLFGEFMEHHFGYLIAMSLPLYVVTVGGRNDTVLFNIKTTSKDVEEPTQMKHPVPCVRTPKAESRTWVNYIMGIVNEFKGHVPGFDGIVHSNVPIQIGVHSCSALQSSIYTFLENLTRECTSDPLEKVERCNKSEFEFLPTPEEMVIRCSSFKFLPVFLSEEGHLMLINCQKNKVCNYFFDDPSYVFVIASCKRNTTDVNAKTLEERLRQTMEALEILGRKSLLNLDLKHIRCLEKRDATEETVKRVKYVITEHQRTVEAVKAIKDEDYARVGLLMNQSHASLRDDYEVSSPEIEALIEAALNAEGVLGAKMLGSGLNTSIIILIKISDAEKCIRYMRKNYKDKSDKPVFYIIKPAGKAFAMNPTEDVPYIL